MTRIIRSLILALFISTWLVQVELPSAYADDDGKAKVTVRKKRKRVSRRKSKEIASELSAKSGKNDLSTQESGVDNKQVQTIILLDSSRSMKKTDPKRVRDQGARLFLQFLEPKDSFSIIHFSEEAEVVLSLNPMSEVSGERISQALQGIENEGNFTDFLPPLQLAMKLFDQKKSFAGEKVVILLTDGQVDPNPKKGDPAVIRQQILEELLPTLKKKGIRVFTLALSDLADVDFLQKIAKETDADAWRAEKVNEIHRIFSDLFLTIKKPQVLELKGGEFEIDNTTQEATFFVNRTSEEESIVLLDPIGNEYTNKNFPSQWKWFRGPLFDVITIPKPLPGVWGVVGGKEDVSGFAKLLTNLNLEYSWPQGRLSVGDSVLIKVRLTENNEPFDAAGLKDLVFITFKIIDIDTGQIYLRGKLNDAAQSGDEAAGDGIYSDTISINKDGNYKLFVSATAPTFSRQVHIPFTVGRGLISLEKIPMNEFTGAPEYYRVSLNGLEKTLVKRKVVLVATLESSQVLEEGEELSEEDEPKPYSVLLTERYDLDGKLEFPVPMFRLKPGKNKIFAVVKGVDAEGKQVVVKSEELVVVGKATEAVVDQIQDEIEIDVDSLLKEELAPPKDPDAFDVMGFIGTVLSMLIGGFYAFFFLKKAKSEGGVKIEVREAYSVPEDLSARLQAIVEKASETRLRMLRDDELLLFSSMPQLATELKEILGGSGAPEEQEQASEEEGSDGDSESGDGEDNESGDSESEESESSDSDEEEGEEVTS